MILHDFKCEKCGTVTEDRVNTGTESIVCPVCGDSAHKIYLSCASTLTTIIPHYPGSKKRAAGYVHTHADRPATKVMGKGWSGPE